MPIYEYVTLDEGCDYCAASFEIFQAINDEALETCPCCDEPVRKLLSGFMVGKGDPLRPSNLDSKGFTQYKRMGKGYYEKTAGPGPNSIANGDS
tara:strand:+ start:308 stop:589 length:282 start_codon:yes stop_codon:yes gene_type:complete